MGVVTLSTLERHRRTTPRGDRNHLPTTIHRCRQEHGAHLCTHFLTFLPQISEICYLRNLFNEDCFIPKNYAGVMINALHPMDREEKHIHNQEAWQLTRWLEEGVFGTFARLS